MPATKSARSTKARAQSAARPAAKAIAKPSMKFEKARPETVAFFDTAMPGPERGVEKRQMFGSPVRFVNGNMAMGLHNNRIILRLSEADRARFLKLEGASIFEPMAGRPMREYVVVPQGLVEEKAKLKQWIERSLAYVGGLPAKARKPQAR